MLDRGFLPMSALSLSSLASRAAILEIQNAVTQTLSAFLEARERTIVGAGDEPG